MTFSNILVATDFSAGAHGALDFGVSLARRLGASVHLLHVVEDPVLSLPWSEDRLFDLARLRDALVSDGERRLAAIAASHPDIRLTRETITGRPAEAIVHTAAQRRADVIVLGTHGRSGLVRIFLGSVAGRVVRLAACPVLTVRDTSIPGSTAEPAAIAAQA